VGFWSLSRTELRSGAGLRSRRNFYPVASFACFGASPQPPPSAAPFAETETGGGGQKSQNQNVRITKIREGGFLMEN